MMPLRPAFAAGLLTERSDRGDAWRAVRSLLDAAERDRDPARRPGKRGANMGAEAVAEGVETAEQRDRLFKMGCQSFQGYFLGRPGPAHTLVSYSGLPPLDQHIKDQRNVAYGDNF